MGGLSYGLVRKLVVEVRGSGDGEMCVVCGWIQKVALGGYSEILMLEEGRVGVGEF